MHSGGTGGTSQDNVRHVNKRGETQVLFLLFVIVPIAELYLLLAVGSRIGFFATLATVLLTAAVGSRCVRQQGLSILMRLRQQVERGTLPGRALVEGMLVAVSGILLVTPGFLTDGAGILLLIPRFRQLVAHRLITRYAAQIHHVHTNAGPGSKIYPEEFHRVGPRASEMEIIDDGNEDV